MTTVGWLPKWTPYCAVTGAVSALLPPAVDLRGGHGDEAPLWIMFMRVAVHLAVLGSFRPAHIDSPRVGVAVPPPLYVSCRFEMLILTVSVVSPFRSI
ncbi:hypothetical protein BD779DRAFT_1487497, partial [Infundibulicybe gibba]